MTINDQYNKWKENTLKKSLDKFKERKECFETSSGVEVPRVALPLGFDTDGGFDTPDEHGLLNQRGRMSFQSQRCIGTDLVEHVLKKPGGNDQINDRKEQQHAPGKQGLIQWSAACGCPV